MIAINRFDDGPHDPTQTKRRQRESARVCDMIEGARRIQRGMDDNEFTTALDSLLGSAWFQWVSGQILKLVRSRGLKPPRHSLGSGVTEQDYQADFEDSMECRLPLLIAAYRLGLDAAMTAAQEWLRTHQASERDRRLSTSLRLQHECLSSLEAHDAHAMTETLLLGFSQRLRRILEIVHREHRQDGTTTPVSEPHQP